jgi:hypothetical protein
MPAPVPLSDAPRPTTGLRPWCALLAVATAAAGVLHVVTAVVHVGASEVVVGFFLVAGFGQLAAAGSIAIAAVTGARPGVRLLTTLLTAMVVLIGLYLVAHTTDLFAGLTATDGLGLQDPHGADHEGPSGPVSLGTTPLRSGETAGPLGTATVAVELLAVVAITALLPPRGRRLSGNVLLALGTAAWVLWLTGVLG